jgi:hypothetical protein
VELERHFGRLSVRGNFAGLAIVKLEVIRELWKYLSRLSVHSTRNLEVLRNRGIAWNYTSCLTVADYLRLESAKVLRSPAANTTWDLGKFTRVAALAAHNVRRGQTDTCANTLFCNSDLDKSTTGPPFIRWETWRFPQNLSGAHLDGVYLIGVCLMGVCLMGVYLMGVHLMGTHPTGMHLVGVHLTGVHLTGMYLTERASHMYVSHKGASHRRTSQACISWVCTSSTCISRAYTS